MKKILKATAAAILLISMTGCQQTAAKRWGGEATIELKEGQKLQEVTWKDDSLWILTRDRHEDEKPETYTFYEENDLNVLEGKVTLIEK